jgi:Kazal-type serine protease inhibitor domain
MATMSSRQMMMILAATLGLTVLVPTGAGAVGPDELCDGYAPVPCDHGLFCDHKPGSCQAADDTGKCVKVSTACIKDFKPVCGCDGKTHGNDCERLMAQARLDHVGECK